MSVYKILLFTLLAISNGYGSEVPSLRYTKISLESGLELIDDSRFGVESPAVSDDGKEVCFIGKNKNRNYVYPVNAYTKRIGSSSSATKVKKKMLNVFTKCAYSPDGSLVLSELKYSPFAISASLFYSLRNEDFEPKRYRSVISIYSSKINKGFTKDEELKAISLGQNHKREFIKHPRVSPDGKWIVYYTSGIHGKKGIFLYHINSKKTVHLGERAEKHPTWSADGSKVLFHYQVADRKAGGLEKAYLGYYEVRFFGFKVEAKRVMLDNSNDRGYIYHKHPALYPGTDLLFFHGQTKPEGGKKLYVRRLRPNSKIFELEMKKSNISLKKAKHPAVSRAQSGLVFVGKESKKNARYKVYRLNDNLIQQLEQEIN